MIILNFIGPQACGKSTQAKILKERFGESHVGCVGMGDEIRARTKTDNRIKEIVERGDHLPDKDVLEIFVQSFERVEGELVIILDGCTRTGRQSEIVYNYLNQFSEQYVILTVHFNLSREEAVERALGRNRSDDLPAPLNRRLNFYYKHIDDVLAHIKGRIVTVDASQKPEEIAQHISDAIGDEIELKTPHK